LSERLPIVSRDRVISALKKFNYQVISQKGSHVKLTLILKDRKHSIVIPRHRELDRGTLMSIIKKVSEFIDKEEFIKEIKGS